MNKISVFLVFSVLALTACERPVSDVPQHRISVIADPEARGKLVAIPKPCLNWHYREMMGLENHLTQDFNCAEQYNLGMQVERPGDLLRGHAPGGGDANTGVLGIERYRMDKKKELINPKEISATSK